MTKREGESKMKEWMFISYERVEAETKEDAFIELREMIDSGRELSGLFLAREAHEFERLTDPKFDIKDELFDEYCAAIDKIYKNRSKKELSDEEIVERNKKSTEILRNLLGMEG